MKENKRKRESRRREGKAKQKEKQKKGKEKEKEKEKGRTDPNPHHWDPGGVHRRNEGQGHCAGMKLTGSRGSGWEGQVQMGLRWSRKGRDMCTWMGFMKRVVRRAEMRGGTHGGAGKPNRGVCMLETRVWGLGCDWGHIFVSGQLRLVGRERGPRI